MDRHGYDVLTTFLKPFDASVEPLPSDRAPDVREVRIVFRGLPAVADRRATDVLAALMRVGAIGSDYNCDHETRMLAADGCQSRFLIAGFGGGVLRLIDESAPAARR